LHWTLELDSKSSPLKVLQTRVGADPGDPARRQFIIDFGGPGLDLSLNESPNAETRSGENGVISHVQVIKNELSKSWRAIFSLTPKAGNNGSIDIQCTLKAGNKALSETWNYRWNPLLNQK
jgi:periplasmic glucans biosynthesis protein